MKVAVYVLLMCFCTLAAAADTSSTALCVKPRGKVCSIKVLTEVTSDSTSGLLLPDLTDRVELHVATGQVKALTEANTQGSNMEKLRILRLEALGLESVLVREHFAELHLSGNRIVNLTTTGSPRGNCHLKVLDLRKNQFANVSQLQPFGELVELQLDDNQITVLPLEPFTRMSQLRVLSLAGNRINQIVPSVARFELGELEYFSLARNELVRFGTANWELPSLKALLLNNNRLVELPDLSDFEQFFSLEQLTLGANDWSCSWLDSVLGSVLREDRETSIKLDNGPNTECPSEKVSGICCKFTISSSNDTTPGTASSELFVPEIHQARQQTEKLTAIHDEFKRSWDERLKALHTKLQSMLVIAMAELQTKKPVTVLQVTQLRQELEGLRNQSKPLETGKELHHRMEKRLAHFMIEMKNKLLQQTIETDKLLSQVYELRYSFDQQLKERTAENVTSSQSTV